MNFELITKLNGFFKKIYKTKFLFSGNWRGMQKSIKTCECPFTRGKSIYVYTVTKESYFTMQAGVVWQ